jgi:hypothetical protein
VAVLFDGGDERLEEGIDAGYALEVVLGAGQDDDVFGGHRWLRGARMGIVAWRRERGQVFLVDGGMLMRG